MQRPTQSAMSRVSSPPIAVVTGMLAMFVLVTPTVANTARANGQIAYDLGGNGVVVADPDGADANLVVPGTCCAGWSHDGSKLTVPYGTDDGRIGTATIKADGSGYAAFPIND